MDCQIQVLKYQQTLEKEDQDLEVVGLEISFCCLPGEPIHICYVLFGNDTEVDYSLNSQSSHQLGIYGSPPISQIQTQLANEVGSAIRYDKLAMGNKVVSFISLCDISLDDKE